MSVRVTIETASKAEAELLAALLRPTATAESWRGFGVIRLALRDEEETAFVIETVAEGVDRHDLPWTRVRVGDEERVFGTKRRETRRGRPTTPSPADTPARPERIIDRLADGTFAEWLESDSGSTA